MHSYTPRCAASNAVRSTISVCPAAGSTYAGGVAVQTVPAPSIVCLSTSASASASIRARFSRSIAFFIAFDSAEWSLSVMISPENGAIGTVEEVDPAALENEDGFQGDLHFLPLEVVDLRRAFMARSLTGFRPRSAARRS